MADIRTRTTRRWLAPTALAAALALSAPLAAQEGGNAAAADTLTKPQVQAMLEAKGYTKVHDIEFDNGMWEAEAESADGRNVDVRLDPRSGTIYPDDAVAELGEADIRARLAAAGYTDVKDVEFDDGMWTAEADTAQGQRMELKLDPRSGEVVGQDRD
jgi:uncharacterized membrane protein YkoI